jgi:hypothetical protein
MPPAPFNTFYSMRQDYACLQTATVIHLPHRNKRYSLGQYKMKLNQIISCLFLLLATSCQSTGPFSPCQSTGPFSPNYVPAPHPKDNHEFVVKVTDSYGAEGYSLLYYRTFESVAVMTDDEISTKQVFKHSFSKSQRDHWKMVLSNLFEAPLRENYLSTRVVNDGIQMAFIMRPPKRNERTVRLNNFEQEDLYRFCDEIDRIVPDNWRTRQPRAVIYGPEGKE